MKELFEDDIREMEELGEIYRKIKETFNGDVSLTYADPRNVLTIWHYHVSQWRKKRIGFLTMLKGLLLGVRRCAIFYNGHWVNEKGEMDGDLIIERMKVYQRQLKKDERHEILY